MHVSGIQGKIYEIRGYKVMVDSDLAELYGVTTKVFRQAVKRNAKRFPGDFAFVLTQREFQNLRSQIVTSSLKEEKTAWGGRRYLPMAFTEQGIAMLSSVLKSEKAISVNIVIMRIFVLLRQYAGSYAELKKMLLNLEKKYKKDHGEILNALKYLMDQKSRKDEFNNRVRIGFKK